MSNVALSIDTILPALPNIGLSPSGQQQPSSAHYHYDLPGLRAFNLIE